ncbi:hypothetical protein PI125_g16888 [Phytophthora idaei]|nr:hypothetical protein PI125_g16888 [Phytophthora idaei]
MTTIFLSRLSSPNATHVAEGTPGVVDSTPVGPDGFKP